MPASKGRFTRLRKDLGPIDVFAVALGTTLSAGFFLLPGLAVAQAGPAIPIAYALAMIPLVPAMFSIVELATAMPRAGGAYYFLDRSLGPVLGTIGGLGTWLALVLKTAFALVGMGAYLTLLVPGLSIEPVAALAALVLAGLNLYGTREASRLQRALVFGLLGILAWFVAAGSRALEPSHFGAAGAVGAGDVLATTGLVYVSYVGITNVASLSEEVRDPERSLPRGVLLALACVATLYVLGTTVMVGVVPPGQLAGDLTPAGTAGGVIAGSVGIWIMSLAALLASASVATAGLMSAARYPLAMARDQLVPGFFHHVSARGTPTRALAVTTAAVLLVLALLDPAGIAKLAGAFQLLLFATLNLAVIVMRESEIPSYDPGFRSPLYPWMQGFGLLTPFVLIMSLGFAPAMFCLALVAVGGAWYVTYAHGHVMRSGAIYHVFERLGRSRFDQLDVELRSILKEKGLRAGDRFEDVVAAASVLELDADTSFEVAVARAARELARRVEQEPSELARRFLDGTRMGATPVEHGVAIPHLRLEGVASPLLVIARSREGMRIPATDLPEDLEAPPPLHAIFFVVSPLHEAGHHLRFLAQIAVRAEEVGFMDAWQTAQDAAALKEMLLRNESLLDVCLTPDGPAAAWIDRALRDISLPDGCLVVVIRRAGAILVPDGNTVLVGGDRITILGGVESIQTLRTRLAP